MRPQLTAIELCSGAGGMALGLERAGFIPTLLVDNDDKACSTLRLNRPEWNTLEADITKLPFGQWRGIDLLAGGLPCPPYSIAGKGLGDQDERDLFPAMLRIVSETMPRGVIIENVRGILQNRFESIRENIQERLKQQGYRTYWGLYNAADFGVPQNRHRAFMLALHKSVSGDPVWPIGSTEIVTVGEAIGDLIAANGWRGASKWKAQANIVAPTIVGGSKKHGGPDLGPTRARQAWAAIGIDGLGIANDAPEPKFKGSPRLTPRMVARVQGFPDDWAFYGNKTTRCRQIGNALPPQLSKAIAMSIVPCLL